MKAQTKRALAAEACVLLLSTWLAALPARAEIAGDGSSSIEPQFVLSMGITDDPTPWNGLWHQWAPSGLNRTILNPNGEANGDHAPSVLLDPNSGLVLVAWSRNSATGFDVVVSR